MESEATQSEWFYKAWAWTEAHRKQVIGGVVAVLVVGLGVGIYFWQQNQKQQSANDALSQVVTPGFTAANVQPTADELLKVASAHANTDAGSRAILLAAGELFTSGKYTEAQEQFERFTREYRDSSFVGQAQMGIAACLEAQGKIPDAIASYQNIISRRPNDSVVPQAKLAVARLLESQNKLAEARDMYMELTRGAFTATAQEAAMRYEDLLSRHPELAPTNRPSATPPAGMNLNTP